MILSAQQLFSDDQAITATAISTNVIDLGAADTPYGGKAALKQDIGKGTPVPILVEVTEAFNTLTSLTIALEVGATTALGTVIYSEVVTLANLIVGKQTLMQYLPNGVNARYVGMRYTVTGTNPTLGKITAGISGGNQTNVVGA